jgi:hypothetical protein
MFGERDDGHFGVCPHCHKTDGFINIGRCHWMFCREHRSTWCIGSNLFSSWRSETEGEQLAQYEALDFDKYETVEPYFHPSN